ncbi:MAG: pimeloyl-ACP methyl esterase BioG family protein [Desulfopila sp.]|jgi:biotin synthesis protein BioG|nr:pimeloyl-ACP methyl esterase BioG family protein [Desulfopila sp.]
MRSEWLFRHEGDSLILFCNGWGMDKQPFVPLAARAYDVLICSDFREKEGRPDIEKLRRSYRSLILLSWSMGVSYGQRMFAKSAGCFTFRIACNGTLCPVNDEYGIPPAVFKATLDNFSSTARAKFYQRMCRPGSHLDVFLENQPKRSLNSQKCELKTILQEAEQEEEVRSMYSHVLISSKDRIFPSKNQHQFWRSSDVKTIDEPHFPFYRWTSWDNLIESIVS